MATLSSSGIGSGLDVNGLVTQLVAAERQPQQQRINTSEAKANVRLSALGSFRAALAGLQTAARALDGNSDFGRVLRVNVDATAPFTGRASSSAVAGSYDVEVLALARTHKLASGTVASAATPIGPGSLNFTVNGESMTVSLGNASDTLADLRDAINAATDNPGVNASLVHETGGTRLVLTARQPGLAAAVAVSGTLLSFSEVQPAADAQVRIDGFDVQAAGNTVTNAVDGLTLELTKAEPGRVVRMEIQPDRDAAAQALRNFTSSYNAMSTALVALSRYNPETRTAAALNGDSSVRSVLQQLRSMLGGDADSYERLRALGLSAATDGSLQLDESRLQQSLASNPALLRDSAGGSSGLATQMLTVLDGYLGTGGRLETATQTVRGELRSLDQQKLALNRRMSQMEQRYRAQFTALDGLISQLQSTSQFLSSQLASLTTQQRQ